MRGSVSAAHGSLGQHQQVRPVFRAHIPGYIFCERIWTAVYQQWGVYSVCARYLCRHHPDASMRDLSNNLLRNLVRGIQTPTRLQWKRRKHPIVNNSIRNVCCILLLYWRGSTVCVPKSSYCVVSILVKSTLKAHSPNCAQFSRDIFYGVSNEDIFLMTQNLSHNSVVKITI